MAKYSDSDVTLRPLQASDAEDSVLWYSDEKVSKFCSWEPFTTRESAVDHFMKTDLTRAWVRAICVSDRAGPCGSINVNECGGNDRCRAEIGYVVASGYWGKGVATRAVKLAAEAVFKEWGHLERLQAVVDMGNPASQRVLEKAGFVKEGVLRKYYLLDGKASDAVLFSLLATDM